MPPRLAQGAATSVEDGFILGTLLGRMSEYVGESSPRVLLQKRIWAVLCSYETLQRDRTARIVSASRFTGLLDRLPPGPDQRARDAEFALFDPETTISAMPWIDARANTELLGRRVDDVAERGFARLLAEGELAEQSRL
jgi:2-polyprenyl-6-methoxyphenol hydroxylase-like FAD-dependent oxidoreductase